jgi:hypothetical protein
VPEGWDAEETFGGVEGSVAGYVGSEKLILATRVGGRAMWGKYPWFESASISGTVGNVRGYYDGRYCGDSARAPSTSRCRRRSERGPLSGAPRTAA